MRSELPTNAVIFERDLGFERKDLLFKGISSFMLKGTILRQDVVEVFLPEKVNRVGLTKYV